MALPGEIVPCSCPVHCVDLAGGIREAVAAVKLPLVETGVDRVKPFEVHMIEAEREEFSNRNERAQLLRDAAMDVDPLERARKEKRLEIAQRIERDLLPVRSMKPDAMGEWIVASVSRMFSVDDVPLLQRSSGPDKVLNLMQRAGIMGIL